MGSEQSLQTKKSVNKKDKKPVDKKVVKKPVDKKVVKKPVDKKVVKNPVDKKVVKKPVDKKVVKKPLVEKEVVKKKVVKKKVVKKSFKGGVVMFNPLERIGDPLTASQLNYKHIGKVLRCAGMQESGIIDNIEVKFDSDEGQNMVYVTFRVGTSFSNAVSIALSLDEDCYVALVPVKSAVF